VEYHLRVDEFLLKILYKYIFHELEPGIEGLQLRVGYEQN